jgi:hypothetical protein
MQDKPTRRKTWEKKVSRQPTIRKVGSVCKRTANNKVDKGVASEQIANNQKGRDWHGSSAN